MSRRGPATVGVASRRRFHTVLRADCDRWLAITLRRLLLVFLVPASALLTGLLALAPPAEAAFPGLNGKIAFAGGFSTGLEITTIHPSGMNRVALTQNDAYDQNPAWSPDGQKIAFDTYRDGNYEVYAMNANGTAQINLTNSPAGEVKPTWSPDGAKIAFMIDDAIYTMNANGTGKTRLTFAAALDSPAWSPDGAKIAFEASGIDDSVTSIYTMNANGTSITRLTAGAGGHPTWSPDGAKIAFKGGEGPNAEIYSINVDGTGQTKLTNNWDNDFAPTWSPDGTKIAFMTDRNGCCEIYVMNSDGTAPTRLTSGFQPNWQTVDITAPQTTINAGPSGSTDDSTPTFSFSSSQAGSSFQCRVDIGAFAPCGSPYTTAGLMNGLHTLEVRATDAAGNTDQTPASRSFTVLDTTAPQTTIDTGPSASISDLTPTFTFSSEPGSSFECKIDMGSFGSCVSPFTTHALPDGPHTFEVRAADVTGNTDQTPASRSFTVDTIAPKTTIDAGPSGSTSDLTPTFSFSSSEAGSSFECRVDIGAFAPCGSPHTTAGLMNGSHTFEVRAMDAAGNTDQTPESRGLTVDTTAPETAISEGPSGPTPDPTPTFMFSSSEPDSTFRCRVDAAAFASCASPHTTTELTVGPHTFEVRATDAAGNVDQTPASRSFMVLDTTAPETAISSGPSDPTPNMTPTFTFSSNEPNSSFRCRVDTSGFAPCTSPHVTSQLTAGPHTFEVRATDAAGNTDQTPASRSFTVLDTTAPQTTITSGPAGLTSNPTPTVTFSSSEAGSTFACRLDGGSFAACNSPHTTSPLADGTHILEVRATDPAGNTDASPASRAFSVDAPPNTVITAGPPLQARTASATFEFHSTQPNSTFQCRKDGGQPAPCVSPWSLSELAEGSHSFEVIARDSTGNVDPTPAVVFWNIDTTVDSTAPETSIISGPAASTASGSATFEFSASAPESSFACRLDTGGWSGCSSPVTYSGLSAGSHAFYVRATDQAGNVDLSPAMQAWTIVAGSLPAVPGPTPPASNPPGLDTTPPALNILAKNKRRAVKQKGIVVEVACPSEACTATAAGRILIPGAARALKLTPASVQIEKGSKAMLKLRFSKKMLGMARRALRKGKTVRVQVVSTAKDAAGNVATTRRTFSLKS